MAENVTGGVHVQEELLGLHFMDALEPAESKRIHEHLEGCPACQGRADEVCGTIAALALLETSAPTDVDLSPPPTAPAGPPAAARRPRRGSPGRPPGRSSGRLPDRRKRPVGKLVYAGALLALTLVIGALGVTTFLRGPGTGEIATVAAEGSGSTGASASVHVAENTGGGVTVRTTVTGLEPGTPYVLYAATSDQQILEVARWNGTSEVQELEGHLPVPLGSLLSFTITLESGEPVVVVTL